MSVRSRYSDVLLQVLPHIHLSTKVFHRKVSDTYFGSKGPAAAEKLPPTPFKTIHNKRHCPGGRKTAIDIVYIHAAAAQPLREKSPRTAVQLRKPAAESDDNYLTGDEVDTLNRIVHIHNTFPELQHKKRQPMHIAEWIDKLDGLMELSGRDILTHTGKNRIPLPDNGQGAKTGAFQRIP